MEAGAIIVPGEKMPAGRGGNRPSVYRGVHMKKCLDYLMRILGQATGPWVGDLHHVLLSAKPTEIPVTPQHCTVQFALSQATRRLKSSRAQAKQTFGIESLIEELHHLDKEATLACYVISTARHLGTCYILSDRLLGCEFVIKSGTKLLPGLWTGDKPIG